MNKWMIDNYSRAIDLFRRFDVDGDGELSYEEFYAGMRDLNAPANSLELYVLAKKLDRDGNGLLDYLEFSKGLRYYKKEECVPDDGLPPLTFEREKLEGCPCCKLGLWRPVVEKFPRFLSLELKLITFANLPQMKNYPGHFQLYVHAHVSVHSIAELISQRFGGTPRNISIFCETKDKERVLLDHHKKLNECGFKGGPRPEPQLVELLYDYETEFRDCPLLMCDHYFM
ncbi:uncharacterized protein LOC5513395 isoform X2 [Nematostella vectensis]|nr:uncharacterized protein LOC5513395 isoform X2 [Nematostella vectensis]